MNRDDLRYCFIIDSGTSMYPLFHEIAEKIKDPSKKEIWKNRVYIISNNLPGVQYLMKNGKEDPNNDNSDIAINCFCCLANHCQHMPLLLETKLLNG